MDKLRRLAAALGSRCQALIVEACSAAGAEWFALVEPLPLGWGGIDFAKDVDGGANPPAALFPTLDPTSILDQRSLMPRFIISFKMAA